MKKSIDFLLTRKCNYRCPYCSQSKKFENKDTLLNADKNVINAFLKFLSTIDKEYEITLSGGEPLCHPDFFKIVRDIVNLGFKISVVSNFSFPFEKYKLLKEIAGDNLSELFISLHIGQVDDINLFLDKALEFKKIKGNTNFTVGSVLSEENLSELKKVSAFLKENNIKFELQHLRIKNAFVEYQGEAKEFIKNFPIEKIREKSDTYGKICYAGINFIFIYETGEVYRCYSSRFNKIHSMGNIKDKNFKLYSAPVPCLNKKCTCPKPIINNLIDFNSSDYFKALCLSCYNGLYLPYYAVKNREILKTKLIQSLKFKK